MKVMQEWAWFDGAGIPRSKVRYVDPADNERWSTDGSSMFGPDMEPMRPVNDSDVTLYPIHVCKKHPTIEGAELIFAGFEEQFPSENPQGVHIGYEQEFYLYPIHETETAGLLGRDYCGIGAHEGRDIMVEHARTCDGGLRQRQFRKRLDQPISQPLRTKGDPSRPIRAYIGMQS